MFNDDRIIAGAEWPLHRHQDVSLTYVVRTPVATYVRVEVTTRR